MAKRMRVLPPCTVLNILQFRLEKSYHSLLKTSLYDLCLLEESATPHETTILSSEEGMKLITVTEPIDHNSVAAVLQVPISSFVGEVYQYSDQYPQITLRLNHFAGAFSWSADEDDFTSLNAFIENPDTSEMVSIVVKNENDDRQKHTITASVQREKEPYRDILGYDYDGVVGIPSEKLRLFLHSLEPTAPDKIHFSITNLSVKITTPNEEMLLAKENDECIIGGAFEDGFELIVYLNLVRGLLLSILNSTNWVWLLTSNEDDTFVMTFPYWPLGTLSFFFDEEDEDDEDNSEDGVE